MHPSRRLLALLILAPALVAGALLSGGCSTSSDETTAQIEPAANDSPAGRWFLNEGGTRLILDLRSDGGNARGDIAREGRSSQPIERIVWAPDTGLLTFRTGGDRHWRWYRGELVDGVFRGRATPPLAHADLPAAQAFTRHVTGWHAQRFDRDLVPRAWDVQLADGRMARVRIDREPGSDDAGLIGTFKVFASLQRHSNAEELEYPLHDITWDGDTLRFQRRLDGRTEVFEGHIDGRHIQGRHRRDDDPAWRAWRGTRAELLGHGLTARSQTDRDAWQARTRERVAHLLAAGMPTPASRADEIIRGDLSPITSNHLDDARDDNAQRWPQDYRLTELALRHTLTEPFTGDTVERASHGYLARPTTDTAATSRPAVLVHNRHAGSARQMMDPASPMYWYGDAFARRGYVVLALDVSHRDYGDAPEDGNVARPAIAAGPLGSDWEEDGERTWDARNAIDYLLAQPEVDPSRVVVAGLSLGAEVAIQVAALDTRISAVVAAGYLPDFQVMRWNGNHECWQWRHADINEYVDLSTYLALIAPRVAIVQSGAADFTFSRHRPPFAADRQVVRRARHAWLGDAARLVHLLHPGGHGLRAGTRTGGVYAFSATEPRLGDEITWQIETTTEPLGMDLFELLEARLPAPSR